MFRVHIEHRYTVGRGQIHDLELAQVMSGAHIHPR